MDISVTYTKDEVEQLVIAQHEARFGKAPAGQEWVASRYYGDMRVQNIDKVQPPEPAESAAPALATEF